MSNEPMSYSRTVSYTYRAHMPPVPLTAYDRARLHHMSEATAAVLRDKCGLTDAAAEAVLDALEPLLGARAAGRIEPEEYRRQFACIATWAISAARQMPIP